MFACLKKINAVQIIDINNTACKYFGYLHEELVDKNIKILIPHEIIKNHTNYIKNYFILKPFLRDKHRINALHKNISGYLYFSNISKKNTILITTIQDISRNK